MTLGELKTLFSVYLDDLAFGYFTESQVTRYLNQAQRELQKQLVQAGQNYYTICKQASLVASSCEYYLPQDFLKLHRLEIVLSGTAPNEIRDPILPITLNQQDLVGGTTGTPEVYTLLGNRFKLFPIPDSTQTIKLTYSYRVSDMVLDSDVPDAPEQYHEYICMLAVKDAFIRDDRDASVIQNKIDSYKELMKQDAAERQQDRGRMIVETGSWDGYF